MKSATRDRWAESAIKQPRIVLVKTAALILAQFFETWGKLPHMNQAKASRDANRTIVPTQRSRCLAQTTATNLSGFLQPVFDQLNLPMWAYRADFAADPGHHQLPLLKDRLNVGAANYPETLFSDNDEKWLIGIIWTGTGSWYALDTAVERDDVPLRC